MAIIRWLLFIPAAFVSSVVIGALTKWVAGGLLGAEWFGWTSSGAFSAASFIFVGINVCPRKTSAVKWTLLSIIILLGVLSAFGSFVGENPVASLAGFSMVIVGVGFIKMDVSEIANEEKTPEQFIRADRE